MHAHSRNGLKIINLEHNLLKHTTRKPIPLGNADEEQNELPHWRQRTIR